MNTATQTLPTPTTPTTTTGTQRLSEFERLKVLLRKSLPKQFGAAELPIARDLQKRFEIQKASEQRATARRPAREWEDDRVKSPTGDRTEQDFAADREADIRGAISALQGHTAAAFELKKKLAAEFAEHVRGIATAEATKHMAEDAKWDQNYSERAYVSRMRHLAESLEAPGPRGDIQSPASMLVGILDL